MLRLLISIFLFSILFVQSSKAQNLFDDPSEEINLFNPSAIKDLNIRRATIEISFKYDLDIIHPTNEIIIYEFDKEGFISSTLEINPFRHRKDTIETLFYRNSNKEISTKVKHDPKYTYVELYKYSEGKVDKIENYQMSKTDNWYELLYPDKLMWSDSMSFEYQELKVFNQFGTLYKRFRFETNEDGRFTEIKMYNRQGKWQSSTELSYVLGKLTDINVKYNGDLMFDSRKELMYGQFGLTEEKYYKDNSLEFIRKISYNAVGLPELDITRNEKSKKMTIKKIEWY